MDLCVLDLIRNAWKRQGSLMLIENIRQINFRPLHHGNIYHQYMVRSELFYVSGDSFSSKIQMRSKIDFDAAARVMLSSDLVL